MKIDEIKDNNAEVEEIEDIIVLNHLKNANEEDEEDNVVNEFYIHIVKREKKIEIFDEKEKLKEESIREYYKIENDKKKEIENCFKNSKLKIILKSAEILSDEKIYTKSEYIIKIYDNNNFKELYNINCGKIKEIQSAIELDNRDLIISVVIS